jgi:hypothetical protein
MVRPSVGRGARPPTRARNRVMIYYEEKTGAASSVHNGPVLLISCSAPLDSRIFLSLLRVHSLDLPTMRRWLSS